MLQSIPSQISNEAAEIERFRARHRHLLRSQQQQQQHSRLKVEDLEVHDGRRRKVSAKWCHKQQQKRQVDHQNDSQWGQSLDTFGKLNAFDFSASPEAFHGGLDAPCAAAVQDEQHMADVAMQVTSMGFHCTNMWQPTAGPGSLGVPPMHYATQPSAPYHQPQYFA